MTIDMNGKQLALSFTVRAVCDAEKALGCSLYDLLNTSVSSVRALLFCGLLDGDKPLTLQQAGDLLEGYLKSGGSLLHLSEALAKALDEAGFFR